MHGSSSTIKIPVDVTVSASGMARRGDEPAPSQAFVRIERDRVRVGDLLLHPVTCSVHRVLEIDGESVMIATSTGPLVVAWDEVETVLVRVVEWRT